MCLKILLLVLVVKVVVSDICELHTNCSECIRDPHHCVWCSAPGNYSARCRSVADYPECPSFENPMSQIKLNPSKNKEYQSTHITVIQIRPQEYNIKLRPGQTVDFKFTFKRADDYPVDMYFLVDLSKSMEFVKTEIATASQKIIDIMKQKTKNVFLGFGSFIDKNALPYVYVIDNLKTYSYKNHLTLNDDIELFRKTVENASLGTNADAPEGGLDALAQVLVCNNVTGWRDISRKIVLFFTDAPSHTAGDGMLGGIYTPYDGKCYTENNIYTKEIDLDYPSIGIINKLAFEKKATVIFIVKDYFLDSYKVLNHFILESLRIPYTVNNTKRKRVITFDHNNLETSLSDIYERISTEIALHAKMTETQKRHMKIQFSPDCNSKNTCTVNGTEELKFEGSLTLLKYFEEDKMDIDISINGYTDKVTLAVEVIKDCPCARSVMENSTECNHGGKYVCGICECNSDRYGNKCMCTKNQNLNTEDQDATCKDDKGVLCSGIGICNCGTCQCLQQGFTGKFCQCDSNSCPNQCNGNGKCNCGVCECGPAWTGPECDCSTAPCVITKGKRCSGRGKCLCGRCDCRPLAVWDARNSQDESCTVKPCNECHTKQCTLLQPCAYCQRDGKNCKDICHTDIKVHLDINATGSQVFTCDEGKVFRFQYKYLDDVYGISLYVDSDKNKLENFIVLGIIVVASLIVVGLCTVVGWKVLTDFRDRQEYVKFMKDHTNEGDAVCRNPMYAPPSTTFKNPAFRKRSVDFRL